MLDVWADLTQAARNNSNNEGTAGVETDAGGATTKKKEEEKSTTRVHTARVMSGPTTFRETGEILEGRRLVCGTGVNLLARCLPSAVCHLPSAINDISERDYAPVTAIGDS